MGGSRNAEDMERVEQLWALAKDLHLEVEVKGYVGQILNHPF
jgi:hypothetical protein